MTIPEARRLLRNLAATLSPKDAAEIERIVKEGLYRRKGVLPVPPKNRMVTKQIAQQIRIAHAQFPEKSEQELAAHFGVNSGRVSEALIGKRT